MNSNQNRREDAESTISPHRWPQFVGEACGRRTRINKIKEKQKMLVPDFANAIAA